MWIIFLFVRFLSTNILSYTYQVKYLDDYLRIILSCPGREFVQGSLLHKGGKYSITSSIKISLDTWLCEDVVKT